MVGATPAKGSALAKALGRAPNNAREVISVEDAGEGEVVALTTSTGNYIAEGWLVHNCDTPYTWDASRFDLRKELTRRPVPELVDRLLDGAPGIVVITGGEPLLHQRRPGWTALLDALTTAGVEIEVEANGTLVPSPYTAEHVTRFNVSPKLDHAGDPEDKRIRPEALAVLVATGRAAFKFVCRTPADVDQVAAHASTLGLPAHTVWVMPEGTTTAELDDRLRTIADPAIAAGFNLTTRLHVHAWGDERAR
ncbi:7-carboxy-7-deazaguanine synthase QueE [Streptomyces atratus]|uniref:7-carboxy-7-deazaguanine synthase n=2 Tax=Streptomyces atratus TaxID=1893 RepID=A0A2Z5JQ07_STRAR|nr:7-carboxy-7-deazaguanine synthase QueE [Streptomyces atratus]